MIDLVHAAEERVMQTAADRLAGVIDGFPSPLRVYVLAVMAVYPQSVVPELPASDRILYDNLVERVRVTIEKGARP